LYVSEKIPAHTFHNESNIKMICDEEIDSNDEKVVGIDRL